jgi:hypothetical protein
MQTPVAFTFTFSGAGYTALPQPMIEWDISGLTGTTACSSVRTVTGGAATGTITCTPLGVAEVQTITPGAVNAGAWRIRYHGDDGVLCETAAMAFNADAATIQTAVRLIHADMAAVVVTDSGSAGLDDGTVTLTWPTTGATAGPHNLIAPVGDTLLETAAHVLLATTRTGTGVNGDFISGSFIQPTDGSETPLCMVNEGYGIKVTDEDAASIDVPFAEMLIGGSVVAKNIIGYPAGNANLTTLCTWIKTQLRAVGNYVFDDDF